MCGILGQLVDEKFCGAFDDKLALLNHRGPDAIEKRQFAVENKVLQLGHSRLAIIDLDMRSNQPMIDETKRYALVYNGEIYNYAELRSDLQKTGVVFNTESDTEVLLRGLIKHGSGFIRELRGMFAFCFCDFEQKKFILARDHFGIKPLYYKITETGFEFSSQLRTFDEFSQQNIDDSEIERYLIGDQTLQSGKTILQGVYQLLPAQLLEISLQKDHRLKKTIQRYWDLNVVEPVNDTFSQATEKVRELFLKSVQLHMRSDVPVCATLSGGIDSSSIVCAVRHLYPDADINTFSYIADDVALNEDKWIRIVNEYVSAKPNYVYASDDLSSLSEMLSAQDEPVGSTSIYAQFLVMRAIKASNFKVTLDGQGADEYLAGYDTYFPRYLRQCLVELKLNRFIHVVVNLIRDKRISLVSLIKLIGSDILPEKIKTRARRTLANLPSFDYLVDIKAQRPKRATNLKDLLKETLCDYSIPTLLRYADRNAMHFSIEGRVPFLNVELVEYIHSLPVHYLYSDKGVTKYVFREAMRGIVPDVILDRRDKIGFATPELAWLQKNQNYFLQKIRDYNYPDIDKESLKNELDSVLSKRSGYSFSVWRVLNLILFRRT